MTIPQPIITIEKRTSQMAGQDGFTLMELLIYISISTLIVVTLTVFVSDVVLQATRSKIHNAVQQNARLILTKLTHDIRTADQITSVDPDQLVLVQDGTTITYFWDATDHTMYYDNGSGLTALSAKNIRVTHIAFSSYGTAISVNLTIEQANPDAPPAAQSALTLQSSIVPRTQLY